MFFRRRKEQDTWVLKSNNTFPKSEVHVGPTLTEDDSPARSRIDLLYVIAYGPSQVKPPAVQMLFHYWPNLKPPGAISEYRGLQYTGKIRIAL